MATYANGDPYEDDFEADEEARKLVKCEHMFHKLCIDQVSLDLPILPPI